MADIVEMLNKAEQEVKAEQKKGDFYIWIRNARTDKASRVPVFRENTLGQVAQGYGEAIGLNPHSKAYIFVNDQNHQSRNEQDLTLKKFGLGPEDVLVINDEGSVA